MCRPRTALFQAQPSLEHVLSKTRAMARATYLLRTQRQRRLPLTTTSILASMPTAIGPTPTAPIVSKTVMPAFARPHAWALPPIPLDGGYTHHHNRQHNGTHPMACHRPPPMQGAHPLQGWARRGRAGGKAVGVEHRVGSRSHRSRACERSSTTGSCTSPAARTSRCSSPVP